MGDWLSAIKNRLGATSALSPPGIAAAMELVLASSDPKIRLVHGYKRKLAPAVESAWQHIARLIETIPGPLDATRAETLFDRLINPFFIDSAQLKKALRNDRVLNRFLSKDPADTFFVLLTMHREVKTILGTQLKGDLLLRDVAMKSIGFSDHKFRVPASSMDDAILALRLGVLQILSNRAHEDILAEKAREAELGRLRAEMTAKLKILAMERPDQALAGRSDPGRQPRAAQKMLAEIEQELSAIKSRTINAGYYLEKVLGVLGSARELLTAEVVDMHMDPKNLLLAGPADAEKDTIRALDVKLGQTILRSCVLLKCSRQVLLNCF